MKHTSDTEKKKIFNDLLNWKTTGAEDGREERKKKKTRRHAFQWTASV